MTDKTVLIFGYGYVAKFLSQELVKLGYSVSCTSRNVPLNTIDKKTSVNLIHFEHSDMKQWIQSAQIILSTVPPNQTSNDPVLNRYKDNIISNKNKSLWIGYLSSTGVYGDHQGQWVDEKSICIPNSPQAERRILAEKMWLDGYTHYNLPVHLFRLSGIYGVKRNCLERIKQGKNHVVLKEGQYFSRIHVVDICNALIASTQQPTPGEIYNVSDNEPASLDEVEQYGATLINAPKLQEILFEEADLSPMAATFFASNRKVSSQKIVSSLGLTWSYPNYRIGLDAIKTAMSNTKS